MLETRIVRNMTAVDAEVTSLKSSGYSNKQIYIFAKDEELAERIANDTQTLPYRVTKKSFFETLLSAVRSNRNDRIAQLSELGMTKDVAEDLEDEVRHGRIVIVGSKSDLLNPAFAASYVTDEATDYGAGVPKLEDEETTTTLPADQNVKLKDE
ncbi:general stress protein [Exiguobacterium sp. Leaf187]|uniref:General stress protein n=2 Tax=Exiguobacterium TaxID=33986 RepID=A0AAW3ME16_9BACL|nr:MULTISPECIES: general stress protein [Exiguobacterium]AHA29764.1 general stress protein [Exiguobacterium sp. MH3]AOT00683.1 general stress protein [Exiguobacterium sp. U13-1]KNH35827.1 general stress protein [Exiguobacterium acetylicum]KQS18893.1 general stress protein [Exiguobacterium sp. Leaf187]KQS45357.1 general stress protein [Exiguobacterium sp. Leaf196]